MRVHRVLPTLEAASVEAVFRPKEGKCDGMVVLSACVFNVYVV
jgi:hypothetical protein